MTAPLQGVRIVVTRAEGPGLDAYLAAFEAAGATALPLPLLEITAPADARALSRAAAELPLYDWIAVTSAHAVRSLVDSAAGAIPRGIRVAAVGEATARALREHDIEPELVARQSDASGLVDELAPFVSRRRILLPQAADAAPTLAEGLRQAGADVVAVEAYAKRIPPAAFEDALGLFEGRPLGWVTFTSPSTFHNFTTVLGSTWSTRQGELLAAVIGPVTGAALRRAGIEPACQAAQPNARSLVEAVVRDHRSR